MMDAGRRAAAVDVQRGPLEALGGMRDESI
jgi:hypothetical protein